MHDFWFGRECEVLSIFYALQFSNIHYTKLRSLIPYTECSQTCPLKPHLSAGYTDSVNVAHTLE